ncbi:Sphingolipid 4-desaturase [Aphelenchoides bicaudatus]|nr:Sphingolipid 4-desaturase [Aphelenchoides bicaudatus]
MGQRVSSTDFPWTYGEQPHSDRRKAIVRKYPEVKKLFGVDPSLKVCYSDWLLVLLQAYFFGGIVNHALALAIHDVSHNTAFGNNHALKNRFFGMFANLPIGVPISISFKKYHVEHHRYLSEDGLDTDLPTEFEAKFFTTPFQIINAIVQIAYDIGILYFCGIKSLIYLVAGTFLAMGPHLSSAHFISEHYAFNGEQETYSYYGVWNLVLYNVGYHTEHHDFPYIPGRNLPKVSHFNKLITEK